MTETDRAAQPVAMRRTILDRVTGLLRQGELCALLLPFASSVRLAGSVGSERPGMQARRQPTRARHALFGAGHDSIVLQ